MSNRWGPPVTYIPVRGEKYSRILSACDQKSNIFWTTWNRAGVRQSVGQKISNWSKRGTESLPSGTIHLGFLFHVFQVTSDAASFDYLWIRVSRSIRHVYLIRSIILSLNSNADKYFIYHFFFLVVQMFMNSLNLYIRKGASIKNTNKMLSIFSCVNFVLSTEDVFRPRE